MTKRKPTKLENGKYLIAYDGQTFQVETYAEAIKYMNKTRDEV